MELGMPGTSGIGRQYTYGVDDKGLMYVYDRTGGRMVFYGNPTQGQAIVNQIPLSGGKTTFEGNRYNPNASRGGNTPAAPSAPAAGGGGGGGGTGFVGGGGGAPAKVLDQAQIDALNSQFGVIDRARDDARTRAGLTRDASLREKEDEFGREQGKYKGKKLSTLQDFGGSLTDTNINTRDTIENLLSSISTLGLGGGAALTRQILDNANRSNRQANATQAQDNQALDSAWGEFEVGNKNDRAKIRDQYDYDVGEANRKWAQDRQNTFYKQADVYNAADMGDDRQRVMNEGNNLGSVISNSTFLNPRYTGASRAMATPELGDYTQSIAQYETALATDGTAPAGAPGAAATPGLSVRAVALNDRDLGVKKKTEGDLAYGV